MKAVLAIMVILTAFAGAWALDVYSTPGGGVWSSESTWQGGTIPGEADNVFLQGPVGLNGNLGCHNLTVYPGGRLYPHSGNFALNVLGSVVNNGTVDNEPGWYVLRLICAGNISNSGDFTPVYLDLSGSGNQNLNASGYFRPGNITKLGSAGAVTLLSDLNLENCQISFNGGTLNLSGGRQLSLLNGTLTGIAILGSSGGSLNLTGVVNLWDVTADEIILQGTCSIGSGVSIGTLRNYAVVHNYPYSPYTLSVTGDLYNYGTLENYPGWNHLSVELGGNLHEYGLITNNLLTLTGNGTQNLWQAETAPAIACASFNSVSAANPARLASNLRMTGCTLDFQGRGLELYVEGVAYELNLAGNLMRNAVLHGGPEAKLNCSAQCELWDLSTDEIVFDGLITVGSGVEIGTLHNYAVIQSYPYAPQTLSVSGDLFNHGTLQNYPGWSNLALDLAGNLTNYGTIANYMVNLTGTVTQTLWQDNASPDMTCQNFTAQATAAPLQLLSNLRFHGCALDLGGRTLCLFTATAPHTLNVRAQYLRNAVIEGDSASTLNLTDMCELNNLTVDEARFTGEAICNSGVVIGILHNQASLFSHPNVNPTTLVVTERLNNHGILQNYPGWSNLTLDLAGDLYNYNTLSNYTLSLSGDRAQILWQAATAPDMTCGVLSAAYSTYPVQARSNLRFSNCAANFSGRTLDLSPGSAGWEFRLVGQSLQNVVVMGGNGAALNLQADCQLTNVTADEIVTRGNALIISGVTIGSLINRGTLMSHPYVNPAILTVTQNLENWGSIQYYPGWSNVFLYLQGDLHNHGTLACQRTYINGIADQYLKLYPGCSVTSEGGFILVSEIGAGQWYFNGVEPFPEYSDQHAADPFASGVWQLYNGSAWSRHVYINEGLAAPLNLILTVSPANTLTLQWDQVSNATAYKVYYAAATEGPWTPFPGSVTDADTGDGIVTYPLGQSQQHKFYRVASLN